MQIELCKVKCYFCRINGLLFKNIILWKTLFKLSHRFIFIYRIGHYFIKMYFNLLSANPTKWSNTLKRFVGKLPTNCLSVFGHFVILALKGLIILYKSIFAYFWYCRVLPKYSSYWLCLIVLLHYTCVARNMFVVC